MAERAKIELGGREAFAALLFAMLVLGVLAAAASGMFNPMLAGTVITLTVVLILIGYYLVKIGAISRSTMPLWYILVLGIMLIFYGLVSKGVIPLAIAGAMTFAEAVVFTSLLYTILIVAVIGLGAVLYYLISKKKITF